MVYDSDRLFRKRRDQLMMMIIALGFWGWECGDANADTDTPKWNGIELNQMIKNINRV